jgi:3-deoxy-D-manno-octulosonate 8-phosphate phosphatase (KDO 8-P phosphatase)
MQEIIEKAKNIRLVIFDVDGILSTGALTYGVNGNETKTFHVHDGVGIRMLLQAGIEVGIITARNSPAVTKRMEDLEVHNVYQGNADKVPAYEDLKNKLGLKDNQIAYIGDDLPDLPLLRRVGLSITVPNAPKIILQHVHHVTKKKGGRGAAREVSELILKAQQKYDGLIEAFLTR